MGERPCNGPCYLRGIFFFFVWYLVRTLLSSFKIVKPFVRKLCAFCVKALWGPVTLTLSCPCNGTESYTCRRKYVYQFELVIMPPTVWKGAISVAFVYLSPSVCPSVVYIANNSRTKRPSVPKFGLYRLDLKWDSHTSFKVKRSGYRRAETYCVGRTQRPHCLFWSYKHQPSIKNTISPLR